MKIGITGSTGVIGSLLLSSLKQKGHRVFCFSGDIRNKADINEWIDSINLDAIFHLASLVPVNIVDKDPLRAFSVNVGGTINLLEALESRGESVWVFYSSSSHVYKSQDRSINEDDVIEPLTVYGETKYFGEQICTRVANVSNLNICIGRIFSFYDKAQKKPFLYPSILERLNNEDLSNPFFLHGAKSVRDISRADKIVEQMIDIMNCKGEGVFNIGSGKGTTIEGFVQSISPGRLEIVTDDNEQKSYLVADTTKLKVLLDSNKGD